MQSAHFNPYEDFGNIFFSEYSVPISYTANMAFSLKLVTLLQFVFIANFADAGRTLRYTFDVSYISGNPDGVWTNSILGINGQFPGPVIEGEVGDLLQVTLINNIQDGQNVTLHWHGILQQY